ncbi:MAG TPA: response regulator [Candidatus Acidoferrales bacterium]|jgi:DNA-binding response OmpR family regulator|nr:response regulator [Candidatus Acidoferrales bacterium]
MKAILIAEDDRVTRHLLQETLKTAGYAVTAVADGAAVLKALKKKKYDLLLLDIWMPRVNGLQLLARLRKEPKRPRVVVMTSDDTPETLLSAVREQAYQFLKKPVDPKTVVSQVKAVLAAHPVARPIEVVSAKPDWVELRVPCDLEAAERIQSFMNQLKADLPEEVRESVGQAFRELLTNAIEWGGKLDPNQTVRVSFLRARRMLLYRISDPGPGFRFEGLTHSAITNPDDEPYAHDRVREEKGLRPGGFGILLTRAKVDELIYNEAQNEVVFVKYLS